MARPTAGIDHLFLDFQKTLAGRYSLERELGRGGMGVVYLAREVRLDRMVAIKLLPPDLSTDERLRERFLHEARLAARLSHPYIVPIFSVDEQDGFVYYVMAYVAGDTLAQRIAARGALPPHDASRVLREVAWALAYAHAQGIVHRDIKPANILLEEGTGRAMVTDFGIARLTHAAGDSAGEILGTPEYMSPEQAAGEYVDGRSDLYSLGVVAFYALSGSLPFTSSTPSAVLAQHMTKPAPSLLSVAGGVPQSLAVAIDRCLEKDPTARFQNGEALAEALAPSRDNTVEIPVPVRVFLDRRRFIPLVMPPAMLIPSVIAAVSRAGASGLDVALVATTLGAVALAIPISVLVFRIRKLLRLGYGRDDIIAALRVSQARRREEFQYEYGAHISRREKAFAIISVTGLAFGALSFAALAAGANAKALGVGIVSTYIGTLFGAFARKWKRIRQGKPSTWSAFWRGPVGAFIERAGAFRLGKRSLPADRPTEVAIAMSAESLYASLPKAQRAAIGPVPEVVRDLETRAKLMRERMGSLDRAIGEARRSTHSPSHQSNVVSELMDARANAEQGLSDVVTSLENLRLDLLRLSSGAITAEGITRDLESARAVSEDVDRMFEGRREVERVLRDAPKLPG